MLQLKVLHVISGLQNGGAEATLYRLCRSDIVDKHIVISLTGPGKYGPMLEKEGIEVICLNFHKNLFYGFYSFIKLFMLIRTKRPNVLQTWMYHADLIGGGVAKMTGIKTICWGVRHSDVHPVKTKLSTRLVVRLCAKVSVWLPAKIICCANRAVEVHRQLGYPSNKCIVIPNGYDLKQFSPNPTARLCAREEFGAVDTMPVLGMVARFDSQKDHTNLLKALAVLKADRHEFRCVLVGQGLSEENTIFLQLLDDYDLTDRTILLGPRNDIPDIMNAIDVHVLSSAYGEAFPNVLAEAMACGTPCVTTDVGDAAMIVGDTGWIVKPQDAHALASALIQAFTLMKNKADWTDRQKRCRNRIVENFSIEKTVLAYRRVWDESLICADL
ncbi:glycosyltransferase family 4 protein [Methylomonas sp. MgM2]